MKRTNLLIADTLAAFATDANGLVSLVGATEVMSVTVPKEAATSGLYYSLLISSDLGFFDPTETAYTLSRTGGTISRFPSRLRNEFIV